MVGELVQRRIQIYEMEFADSDDAMNMGKFAVSADDAIGRDAIGADNGWVEMLVTQESVTSVAVTLGRIWKDGKFYGDPANVSSVVSLATVMPTGAKRIVTIVGYGQEVDDVNLPRDFKNATTGAKAPSVVATQKVRKLSLSFVAGPEAATPQQPSLPPNYIAIAYVTLGSTGVESIVMASEFRVVGLQEATSRLISLENFRTTVGKQIDTLASDLALVSQKVGYINKSVYDQIAKRLAALEDHLGYDPGAALNGFDRFLTADKSYPAGAGYSAKIEEGLRMAVAATGQFTLTLANPDDPKKTTNSGWTLPRYSSVRRLDIWGQYVSVNVANYQYANTSFTIYPGAKRRRRYGTSMVVSGSSDFWQSASYNYNYLLKTFMVAGETWQVTDSWVQNGETYYRVEQYWDDQIKYWNGYQSITPTAANGYGLAQTFVNAQSGWLTQIGLRFERISAGHNVTVAVCKAPKGVPDPDQIISVGTLSGGSAVASVAGDPEGAENVVAITPVFLNTGERYGVILITGGEYAVACRSDNALSNGSLFFTDGNTFVPDLGKDMNMRLYYAQFLNPYTVLDLNAVNFASGINDLDFISTEMTPDGTEIYLEFQKDGTWYRIGETAGTNPLASAPTNLPLRLVFVGTRDIMPAIKLASSVFNVSKAGTGFTHWSETRDAGTAITTVEVEVKLVNWDNAKHTLTATVDRAGNTETPDATTDVVQGDGSILRTYLFTLAASTSTYKIKLVGVTTDAVDQFVVAHRYDKAYTP